MLLVAQILDVNRRLIDERPAGGPAPVDRPLLDADWYRSVMRADAEILVVLKHHRRVIGVAKFASALDDGFEDRIDVGWRRGDHAQDVGAAGLVGEGLRQV